MGRKKTHGLSKHPLYEIWRGMKRRCMEITNKDYANYGGRGVSVSLRWVNNFKAFYDWAIDKWKPGLQLDKDIRSDNKVGSLYCPELCCFITAQEQNNNKRDNVIIEYQGESKSVAQWAKQLRIGHSTLLERFNKGWSPEKIITQPVRIKRKTKLSCQ